jgi:hypothetical protein
VPVLYIGLEMGADDLTARALGLLTGRKWSGLFLGTDDALDPPAPPAPCEIDEATAHLQGLPLVFVESPPRGMDYREIAPLIARWRETNAEHPHALVILDYLQLVTGGEREDLRERIGGAAYALLEAKRKHGCAVLALSSTARSNYAALRGGERAGGGRGQAWKESAGSAVGMGKESGEIEFAADSVLVMAQEPWPAAEDGRHTPPPLGTRTHLGLGKVRAGAGGAWLRLLFNGSRFDPPPADGAHVQGLKGEPFKWGTAKKTATKTDEEKAGNGTATTGGRKATGAKSEAEIQAALSEGI